MQTLSSQTECTNRSAYKEWELEAYADGEEMAHVAAHLAECPVCAAEHKQLSAFSAHVSSKLYRFDCPPPEELRAYYWDDLAETANTQIQTHLADCLHCTGEVGRIQALVETDPSIETIGQSTLKDGAEAAINKVRQQLLDLVDQVDIAVATLVTPLRPQTAGIALRGAQKTPSMLLFEAHETDISLTLQPEEDGRWKIAGQLLAQNVITKGHFKLLAADKTATPETVTERIDESGIFAAAGIPSGEYQLLLLLNDQSIVIPNLTVGE